MKANPEVALYRTKSLSDYHMLAEVRGYSIGDRRNGLQANDPDHVRVHTTPEEAQDDAGEHELLDDGVTPSSKRIRTDSSTPSTFRHLAKNRSNIGLSLASAMETIANAVTEYTNKRAADIPPMSKCIDTLSELESEETVFFTMHCTSLKMGGRENHL